MNNVSKKKYEVFEKLNKPMLNLISERNAKPDKTVKEHTEDLLNVLDSLKNMEYIEDNIYNLTELACLYHDIGKINLEFQKRVNHGGKFNPEKEITHNILSYYFINHDLFEDEDDFFRVASAVLKHHNYNKNVIEEVNKKELISSLIGEYSPYKMKRSYNKKIEKITETQDIKGIKIKGYLHKCDYSASGNYTAEYPNDFLSKSLDNLMEKWKKSNPNVGWNELQKFCMNNKDKNIIAVAQTGMGKTEAGLLWIDDTKGFFVLPLRTAINAIYDRVRIEMLENKNIDKRVAILHSSSLEYYLKNIAKKDDINVEEVESTDILNYENLAKRWSIPLNISTMDQLFDFVFKYQGYELKLTTLSYSKIVIDEIQMYSPELLAYLMYGIKKIYELGGKIAILTATLPPFIRDLLKDKEYGAGITFEEGEFINESESRHNMKVIEDKINIDDIVDLFEKNQNEEKGNKILVVCNTIKEAQSIYRKLREKIDDKSIKSKENRKEDYVNMLHSKFTKMDRASKEKNIIEFGKTFDKNGNIDIKNGIWVSTSIVEASLDIDFDYLFTELNDLNSLFQRMGRINRKGKKDNKNTNIFVYTDMDNDIVNNSMKLLDETIYNLSKEAIINQGDGIISEKDKLDCINTYLTSENMRASKYMVSYRDVFSKIAFLEPHTIEESNIDLRKINSIDIIPSPVYNKYSEDIENIKDSIQICTDKEERIKLKEDLKKYIVSVRRFEVKDKVTTIKLSKYEEIDVYECEYDEYEGFKRGECKETNIL